MSTEIIQKIFEFCFWLKNRFDSYKDIKEEGKQLIQRIEALEKPLAKMKELNSKNINLTTLRNILDTLSEIQTYVQNVENRAKLHHFFGHSQLRLKKYIKSLDSYLGDLNIDLTLLTHNDIQTLAQLFREMRNYEQEDDRNTQIYFENLSQQIQQKQIQQNPIQKIFQYEKTNLGFIEEKFGIEHQSAKIICDLFQLKLEGSIDVEKIMKEFLQFLTSDWNYQIKVLFKSEDLNQNQILSKEQLTKTIRDLYFLITCLQFKKMVGPLQEYLTNLKKEEKAQFYTKIDELVAQNQIDSQIEEIFYSLNLESNQINFPKFESYCNSPGNFVIQFLNLMKRVLNGIVGTRFIITNPFYPTNENFQYPKKFKNLMKIPSRFINILSPNKILEDPVFVNGATYERKYIEKIIQENPDNPTIPETNDRIDPKLVKPILDLKSEIEEWKKEAIPKCLIKSQKITKSNPDIAYQILEFARKLEPNNLEIIDFQISLLEKEFRIPEELAKQQFAKGEILFQNKEYQKAEELLSNSMKNTTNMNLLEKVLLLLKEIYSVFKLISKLIETDISLSRIYLGQNPQKAKDILIQINSTLSDQDSKTSNVHLQIYSLLILADETLGNQKESSNWYFKKANWYLTKKNYSKVIEYLNKAIEINPDNIEALENLVFTYHLMKEKSKQSLLYTKIGQIYSKKTENGQAIQAFQFALLHDKSNAFAFNLLFEILQKQNLVSELIKLVMNYKIQDQETKTLLDKISQTLDNQSKQNKKFIQQKQKKTLDQNSKFENQNSKKATQLKISVERELQKLKLKNQENENQNKKEKENQNEKENENQNEKEKEKEKENENQKEKEKENQNQNEKELLKIFSDSNQK